MTKATTVVATVFQEPRSHPNETDKRKKQAPLDDDQVRAWKLAAKEVQRIANESGRSKAQIASRMEMNNSMLNQWYDGEYPGDFHPVTVRVQKWLKSVAAMAKLQNTIPDEPHYVETPTGKEIEATLLFAQTMPEMVVITTGSGVGKTKVCEQFRDHSPHVHLVTMRPNTKRTFGMLSEIGRVVGVRRTNGPDYDHAIGERLQRSGNKPLLIIDEAQNLTDEAIDQLRFFLDQYRCGIALVGNDEIYTRFHVKGGPSYSQIKRRIGKRFKRMQPLAKDIDALISAWGVTDIDQASVLRLIGEGGGALGQISKTMQLASMYAAGRGGGVTVGDIQTAFQNRSMEA